MSLKKVIATAELPAGTMKHVNIDGHEILIANVGGTFYAINNICPHMGGSLADGTLAGNLVECPRHHSRFDVTTGKNVGSAKIAFLKMKVNDTQSYPVKVEGIVVMVNIPD